MSVSKIVEDTFINKTNYTYLLKKKKLNRIFVFYTGGSISDAIVAGILKLTEEKIYLP